MGAKFALFYFLKNIFIDTIIFMKIIAFDPGYERLGIAILEKNSLDKEQVLYSECFKTSPKNEHSFRLGEIAIKTESLIKEFSPTHMAIETLFFSKNIKTAMKVAETRGVLLAVCAKENLIVNEYSPQAIKVAVTGSGSSDKTQVTKMVGLITGIDLKQKIDDEIDAIATGLTCLASIKNIHS
jgi:crossover junction endodeoxyribonuclease RuvC